MELDRRAPLRICDVNVAHRSRDYTVAKDALHLGKMNTRFQKIGRAAMAELMKTVNRNLCAAANRMHTVADGEP